jgi:hypothetical protein
MSDNTPELPTNTIITKTFTFPVPDAYLYQTDTLKKTCEWTYIGPDKVWIFIDNITKKIVSRFHYTEKDNGHDVPTPEGMTKVLVDANVDPIIISLVHNEIDYGSLPHTVEQLPDGTTYGHPVNIPPDHTYELTEIAYNTATGQFVKPYAWKPPHIDWETLKTVRVAGLASSDRKIRLALPEEVAAWEEYRQKLRDLPATFAGVDPWKVIFPPEPFVIPATLTPAIPE